MERFLDDNFTVMMLILTAFLAGALVGFIAVALVGGGLDPIAPRDFSCTESAVIEGYATCVKYERNK